MQDGVFLAMQDELLRSKGVGAWRSAYYMPSSCDLAVSAVRRWLDAAGSPFAGSAAEAAAQGRPDAAAYELLHLARYITLFL